MTFAEIVKKARVLRNSKGLLSRWLVKYKNDNNDFGICEMKIIEITHSREYVKLYNSSTGNFPWVTVKSLDKDYVLLEELK